jgi:hypothetical protein
MRGRSARRGLWIVMAASWAAMGVLGHYGLDIHPAADIAAVVAVTASACVTVMLWRRVAGLEARCACYEAKLADVFTTMEAAAKAAGIRPEPGLRLCGGTDAQTLTPASRSAAARAWRSPSM